MLDVSLIAMNNAEGIGSNDCDLMVGKIDDSLSMADKWRSVAGDEMFAIANANNQRTPQPRSDQYVGMLTENDCQAIGPAKLCQSVLDCLEQRGVAVGKVVGRLGAVGARWRRG